MTPPAGTSSILAGALLAAVYRCTGQSYDTDSLIHGVLHLEQVLTTGRYLWLGTDHAACHRSPFSSLSRWRLAGSGRRLGGRSQSWSFQCVSASAGTSGMSPTASGLPGCPGAAPAAGVHWQNPPGSEPAAGQHLCEHWARYELVVMMVASVCRMWFVAGIAACHPWSTMPSSWWPTRKNVPEPVQRVRLQNQDPGFTQLLRQDHYIRASPPRLSVHARSVSGPFMAAEEADGSGL